MAMAGKVLQMFRIDEITGLQVPNLKIKFDPLYYLCCPGGGIKCTPSYDVAVEWLLEAIAKSGDPESHWIS